MDPEANLRAQRELAAEAMSIFDNCNDDGSWRKGQAERMAEIACRQAELFQALDAWRKGGGYDPYLVNAQ